MIFRMLISTLIFFGFIFYAIYVIIVSEPCARIERATKPVYFGGVIVQQIAEPWSSPSTMKWLEQQTFKLQLRTALIIRKQFYSNAEIPVICDWDAYADLVGGTPMTKHSKVKTQEVNASEPTETPKAHPKENKQEVVQEKKNHDLPLLPLE